MEDRFKKKPVLLESSQFVKGVGPSRQVLLERLGIETVEDCISHFPRNYYDRSDFVKISGLAAGTTATFVARVLATSLRRLHRGRSIVTVAAGDETGIVNLIFFNQPYLEKQFKQGARIIASGALTIYRGQRQIIAPDYEIVSGELDESLLHTGRIVPVYPLTAGISQRMMRRVVRNALDKCASSIPENLPASLLKKFGFPSRAEAFGQIHYPDSWETLRGATERLKFEEVFFLHLLLKERKRNLITKMRRPEMKLPCRLVDRFIAALPFELTAAQRRVLGAVENDVSAARGLNMLLQGDVGSGKTVIGIAAMMIAVANGYQAALMVPTEILAQQHFERIRGYVADLDIRVSLLIGSMTRSEKEKIHGDLAGGRVDVIVGTHALIQEGISFKQLGLAVIDEQHRFGVKQRARLGVGDVLPHFLVMTATPIPRSLAQTVYGDLDLAVIDELPARRRSVTTEIVEPQAKERVYEAVADAFRDGRQAFILYPLVQESERSDLMAATSEYERLQREVFAGFPIGLLHGRMSFEEKARAIALFRSGEIRGLVTTTVIEVGVDIQNASIIVINNPERFGLAQLHQLRGRVGRSGEPGVCYLVLGEGMGERSMERLAFFASTDDGFRIAEQDLKLRGPGEIWGFRQTGYPVFRLINPLRDESLVRRSWEESDRLLDRDPGLERGENRVVTEYLRLYYKPRMELADIG